MSYQARRVPQTETLVLRGLTFQLYRWPGADPQPIVADTAHDRASLEDLYAPVDDNAELFGCDYDAGRAGAAIAEVDAMTCEEIYEAEYEVTFLEVWEGCATEVTSPYTGYESYTF